MPEKIPAPREEGTTKSTRVPLYWCRYGPADQDPIIVLHGGPGADHRYLLPQMLHLAESHDVLFYDQRGGGRSRSTDDEPVTWQTHVDDLDNIIDEFSLEPLTLIGYSWGGLLATLYSLQKNPNRLALIDPAPFARRYRIEFENEFRRRSQSPEIQRMRAELEASGLKESNQEAYRQRLFELSVAGYFAHPENATNLTPFRVIARTQQSVWDSLGDYDLFTELGKIACPVLIVHGRDDPIPAASSIEGAKAMNARLKLLDDCGHVPYVEQPAKLFAALDEFLGTSR
ncbi:MAG TPA: alpha/beta hydrolase [Gemmatimonadaceae bacterium]|nr:alpha/beta hydrolase [Gemmatimonadaceae bacterium]